MFLYDPYAREIDGNGITKFDEIEICLFVIASDLHVKWVVTAIKSKDVEVELGSFETRKEALITCSEYATEKIVFKTEVYESY